METIQCGDVFKCLSTDHPHTVLIRDITPYTVHFRYIHGPGNYSDSRGEMRLPIFIRRYQRVKPMNPKKARRLAGKRAA